MSPISEMAAEVNRFLSDEAEGDPAHPGARLRVLLLWNISDGDQRDQLAHDIGSAGFMPTPDVFNPETLRRRCSMASVARAVGVPEMVMVDEVDRFLRSPIAQLLSDSPHRCGSKAPPPTCSPSAVGRT